MADSTENPKPFWTWSNIAIIVIIVIILFIIFRYYSAKMYYISINEPLLINKPIKSHVQKPFDGTLIPLSSNGMEWTYSFWIFVKDWNFNYGYPKCVLYRSNGGPMEYKFAAPAIYLYPKDPKLMIRVSTMNSGRMYDQNIFDNNSNQQERYTIVNPNKVMSETFFRETQSCDVSNIPLQRWVHVTVTLLNGNILDTYIDGKIVRSCQLNGIVIQDPALLNNLYVGHGDSYNGYISQLRYFNRAITANEVYNLYSKGPLESNEFFSNLSNQLQFTLQVKTK